MDTDLIMAGVGYWFGFSLFAAMHFFIQEFKRLEATIVTRLWRLTLSLLVLVGVFCYAAFAGYVHRAFPDANAHIQGLFLGGAVYAIFARLWTRNVKRPA